MKRIVPSLLLVVLIVGIVGAAAGAQPQHGDPIVAVGGSAGGGYTAYLSLTNPLNLQTIAHAPTSCRHNWVRMAQNNTDLVVSEVNTATIPNTCRLLHIQPGGGQTPIATLGTMTVDGFDLDHDGWIACAQALTPRQSSLLRVTPGALSPSTILWSRSLNVLVREMAIDRDPNPATAAPYVLVISGRFGPSSSQWGVVLRADRGGNLTSILISPPSPFIRFRCIEVHPRSGDFLLLETAVSGLFRMNKSCTQATTLLSPLNASALKITQDDSVWIAAQPNLIIKYDLTKNAVVRSYQIASLPPGALQGIEVYGSRSLVCKRPSASTVSIRVQSRHSLTGGRSYILAASFARRTGVKLPNGEWLDLDTSDPLFWLTAQNLLPRTFVNFQGVLNGNGDNTQPIQVNIPPWLPKLNGMAVFVAGVIYDSKNNNQIIEVTNTHWFVLP